MPPPALVNAAVAARLAEARKYLRVEAEWIEPPDPRCHGRAFGFWRVMAGPKDAPGWTPSEDHPYARPASTLARGPCTAEGKNLSEVTLLALKEAGRRRPCTASPADARTERLD